MSRISTAEYIAVEPGKAENIVIKLSKLFRYTLTTSERNMVPLSEELDMVSTYLSIEKERFGKRLEYGITTKGDPSNVGIPGLLIQSLKTALNMAYPRFPRVDSSLLFAQYPNIEYQYTCRIPALDSETPLPQKARDTVSTISRNGCS